MVLVFTLLVCNITPYQEDMRAGTSLAVQWLRLHASTAGGADSTPHWGTKTPHDAPRGPKKRGHDSSITVPPPLLHKKKRANKWDTRLADNVDTAYDSYQKLNKF